VADLVVVTSTLRVFFKHSVDRFQQGKVRHIFIPTTF
jgi:hypothetical protein